MPPPLSQLPALIAEVRRVDTPDGGYGLAVCAEGTELLALAAAVICRTLATAPEFDAGIQAAANALAKALVGGRDFPDTPMVHVRGERGQG